MLGRISRKPPVLPLCPPIQQRPRRPNSKRLEIHTMPAFNASGRSPMAEPGHELPMAAPTTSPTYELSPTGERIRSTIQPMEPAQHRASHKEDFSRWGKRPSVARAFGGDVAPPAHAPKPTRGPVVRGLGIFSWIPNVTGMLSGRIRTDSFDNFTSDMLGYPSQEDLRQRNEEIRRRYFPIQSPATSSLDAFGSEGASSHPPERRRRQTAPLTIALTSLQPLNGPTA